MSTEDQGSEAGTTAETVTVEATEGRPSSTDEVAEARAEIERLQAALKATRDEAASKRVKAREAAEKAGEFERAKQLLEEELAEARQQLEEVPQLRAAASELAKIHKAKEERIASLLASVEDEDVRAAIALIPDLDARERAVVKLTAKAPAPPPPGASPAASEGPVQHTPGMSKENPAAWAKLKEALGVPPAQSGRPVWVKR